MMQDLTPTEIEALSNAIGPSFINQSAKTEPLATINKHAVPYTATASYAQFSQLKKQEAHEKAAHQFAERLKNLDIQLDVVLGRTKISIAHLLKINLGSVIPLDKLAGEPVDIEANGTLVAKGEVVVVDEHFGVKITQIIN